MELALSLGDAPKPFSFLDKIAHKISNKDPGFCISSLGATSFSGGKPSDEKSQDHERKPSSDPPFQLDLLPPAPVLRTQPTSQPRIPWLSDAFGIERASSGGTTRELDMNRLPLSAAEPVEEADDGTALYSPNGAVSPFEMDFGVGGRSKRDSEGEGERANSRASDDEENGSTRKKLRLSKEQSAFLEESFKEHNTLNPKQKLALAKQLNLRPRQVEVWFQNRRARTKLKQTEVDCEYLKRCCETLTEENRRLQKELQELRALKTSQPFYMQLPATTLTMCPSCERVATNSSSAGGGNRTMSANASNNDRSPIPVALSLPKPGALPFANGSAQTQQAQAHQMAS